MTDAILTFTGKTDYTMFNNITDMFDKGYVKVGKRFACPVCENTLKTELGIIKHIEKRNCFTERDYFKHTSVETLLYRLHVVLAGISSNVMLSKPAFRRSGNFTKLSKFYVFCIENEITEHEGFMEFLIKKYNYNSNVYYAITKGLNDISLKSYFRHKKLNLTEGENEEFYEKYKEELHENVSYLLRSFERGDISVDYIFGGDDSIIDINYFVNKINDIEAVRFNNLL